MGYMTVGIEAISIHHLSCQFGFIYHTALEKPLRYLSPQLQLMKPSDLCQQVEVLDDLVGEEGVANKQS